MCSRKIKILCRNPRDYVRELKSDIHRVPRNLDPALHPLEGPREYVRAVNAAKLERIFAKPFVANLAGHTDGVCCLYKHPQRLSVILSGACDGEIRIWSLARQECLSAINAHEGFVRGLCMNREGSLFVSVGEDKIIKQWTLPEDGSYPDKWEPSSTILGSGVFLGVDHHWENPVYATCGDQVNVWDENRAEATASFTWGVDSISHVKFNPIETNILATCGSDRSIALYDIRQASALKKVILSMRSNAVAWNPMEAFHFTAANEDSNLYSFDLRQLDKPRYMHVNHVNAVLDVDFSPTGQEFVSGSFDKTVRIFKSNARNSREVYHTKRMQRIFSVRWSNDATYIISGSDETNLRLWKAKASQKLGTLTRRERVGLEYADKLREKYQHHPQVRRISRRRHVPKMVYNATRERNIMLASRRRKEENRRKHGNPGETPATSHKDKLVLAVE